MANGQIETDITMPSRFGRILAVITVAIAAYGLVVTVADSGLEGLLVSSWPFVFVSYLAFAVFWQPSVTVSDGGVTLRNVLRTIHLPWPSIQRIDTKFALTLFTDYGHFAAWAAPAPTRYSVGQTDKSDLTRLPESTYFAGTIRPGDNPASDSGQAALVVRMRWEALRDAGHLDSARLEKERPDIQWHLVTIAALVVLGAAAVFSAVH
ncbi:PH domain-containing protein [Glaciihabitans arcticus]|uniref:PH domain-containing protein n=1 Tax=Glaciihabitans arcticus TaxID=2668039 RepID=A0A4V6MTN5_9MICO|nr:PH domain-containing protein [Glaciihabitans arcticus]TBN57349.1 PH domain-containing protein [Glaciihabitans arcticus]